MLYLTKRLLFFVVAEMLDCCLYCLQTDIVINFFDWKTSFISKQSFGEMKTFESELRES